MHQAAEEALKYGKHAQELIVDEEEIVTAYVKTVLLLAAGITMKVEHRVTWKENVAFGTADVILFDEPRQHMAVIDFKTGKTPVKAHDNAQLQYLSRDALPHMTVTHGIIQPKLHRNAVLEAYTLETRLAVNEEIFTAIDGYLATPSKLCAGKWCSKCKAKSFCPEKNKVDSMPQSIEPAW